LEVIPGKGLGVVTKVRIPKGTVVGDYTGEVMSADEKDRRYLESLSHLLTPDDFEWKQSRINRGQTITGTYLYGVVVPNGEAIYVDAEDEYSSLWTRFLNHASPPDNNVNPKSIHQSWDGQPRVWFVAIRDIEVGEEICFDYGEDYWLPGDNVV
jgi:SET domain-containing protein